MIKDRIAAEKKRPEKWRRKAATEKRAKQNIFIEYILHN